MEKRWHKTWGRVGFGVRNVGEGATIRLGEPARSPVCVCSRVEAAWPVGVAAGSGGESGGVLSPVAGQGKCVDHERVGTVAFAFTNIDARDLSDLRLSLAHGAGATLVNASSRSGSTWLASACRAPLAK